MRKVEEHKENIEERKYKFYAIIDSYIVGKVDKEEGNKSRLRFSSIVKIKID